VEFTQGRHSPGATYFSSEFRCAFLPRPGRFSSRRAVGLSTDCKFGFFCSRFLIWRLRYLFVAVIAVL